MPKYLEWLKEQLQKPDFILVVISEQSESNLNIQIELASELTVNVLFKCYVFIYDVLGYPQEAETHTIDLVMNKFTPSLSHFNVSEFNRSEKKKQIKTQQFENYQHLSIKMEWRGGEGDSVTNIVLPTFKLELISHIQVFS